MNPTEIKANLANLLNRFPSEFLVYSQLETAKEAAYRQSLAVTLVESGYCVVTTVALANRLERLGYQPA